MQREITEKLIKSNYPLIKRIVSTYAHKYFVNESDLLSMVNQKLGNTIISSTFNKETDREFIGYMYTVISNAAVDALRSSRRANVIEYEDTLRGRMSNSFEAKDILAVLKPRLLPTEHSALIYKLVFEQQLEYKEITELYGIKETSIKGTVFQIRKRADRSRYLL